MLQIIQEKVCKKYKLSSLDSNLSVREHVHGLSYWIFSLITEFFLTWCISVQHCT